jgi:hypothetical protein
MSQMGHERRIRANAPAAGRPQTADPGGELIEATESDPSTGIGDQRQSAYYILHSYSSMLITNIEIGTINGEVAEVAINVVINSSRSHGTR